MHNAGIIVVGLLAIAALVVSIIAISQNGGDDDHHHRRVNAKFEHQLKELAATTGELRSYDDSALITRLGGMDAAIKQLSEGTMSERTAAIAALRATVTELRKSSTIDDSALRTKINTVSQHVTRVGQSLNALTDGTEHDVEALENEVRVLRATASATATTVAALEQDLVQLQHKPSDDDDSSSSSDDDTPSKCGSNSQEPFVFGVMGDLAYSPETEVLFTEMINSINANESGAIDFFVHVGDTMALQQCNQTEYDRILAEFNRLNFPLYYTPGDNEWLDCEQRLVGGVEPYVALERVRSTFFPVDAYGNAESLGVPRHCIARQSDSDFTPILAGYDARDYIENQRWEHNSLVFATYHMVGGNDGCTINLGDSMSGSTLNIPDSCKPEYQRRSRANADWITRAFDAAIECDAPALVLLAHRAQSYAADNVQGSCLDDADANCALLELERIALYEGLARFNRPVLHVNGDGHLFLVGTRRLPDFLTTLEVPGDPDTAYVRVTIDPQSAAVFGSFELGYCQKDSPDTISLNCDDLSDLTNTIVSSDVELPFSDICVENGPPRQCEALEANVLNDAMRSFSGSDFAHYNAGGLGEALTCNPADPARAVCPLPVGLVPPYNVTDGSTVQTLRFQNPMLKFTISGAEIKNWLEVGVESMPATSGSFGHWSGLCFEYSIANPTGSRVQRAVIANASNACDLSSVEIDFGSSDKTFTLLANAFTASGGGGYPTDPTREFLPYGPFDVTRDYQAVIAHFGANPADISPRPQCRIACMSTTPLVECPEPLPIYATDYDAACAAW